MRRVINDQSAKYMYNYRNFNILCKKCEVDALCRSDILEFFLHCHSPSDEILLKHFATLKCFYVNMFLAKDAYNGKNDVVRVVLNNCKIKGLRTIIDPSTHDRSHAEKFLRKYKNNRAVLIKPQFTNEPEMANVVRVDEYGLRFFCQKGLYIIQYAKATEFKNSMKPEYRFSHESVTTETVGTRPSILRTTVRDYPVDALRDCVNVLAYQGLTEAARTVKILINSYGVILNDLHRVKNKRAWLDENSYICELLENCAKSAYKQLENEANACGNAARRYEALKSLSTCKPAFANLWNACLRALEQNGIRIIPIKYHSSEFIVSSNQIKDGWEVRNDENRKASKENPVNKVYGVVRNGVLADNEIVKRPIVNVYTE